MRYLSLFSGIEAATVAWQPLGWAPAAFAEIDPFCCAVLRHHYPHVPNLGDVQKADYGAVGPVDLIVFGSPCQSFSTAGRRGGLADARGNLALDALGVVAAVRPRWFLFENVPGLLSSGGGRDFGEFLGIVGQLGYSGTWRILNAEHWGVPQRRHRLFFVGYLGNWTAPAAVLFERHSLSGDPAPRREARQDVTAGPAQDTQRPSTDGAAARQRDTDVHSAAQVIAFDPTQITSKENRSQPAPDKPCHAFTATMHVPLIVSERQTGPALGALASGGHVHPGSDTRMPVHRLIAPCITQNYGKQPDNSDTGAGPMLAQEGATVRRLSPRECERLMGFPDMIKNVTIVVCQNYLDLQKNNVLAAMQNLKWPSAAGNVVKDKQQESVQSVDPLSPTKFLLSKRHAALNVVLNYEADTLEIHNQDECQCNVNIVARYALSRLPRRLAFFVHQSVIMLPIVERIIHDGEAALLPNTKPFLLHQHGRKYVLLSGHEIEGHVNAVEVCTKRASAFLRSTTSAVGRSFPHYGATLQTLCCSVVLAISSYIPEAIRIANSYELNIKTTQGYTNVPYRGKLATDTPRYRALGNSFVVPVVRWIGTRIAQVEALLSGLHAGAPESEKIDGERTRALCILA